MAGYPVEELGPDDDDGTMVNNVAELSAAVIGHRIVSAGKVRTMSPYSWGGEEEAFVLTLDDGSRVQLADSYDCCASTELKAFFLNVERIDHVITGVGTTGAYGTWHIYADMGDVLELTVDWSPGNPFYYGYGFSISVEDAPDLSGFDLNEVE